MADKKIAIEVLKERFDSDVYLFNRTPNIGKAVIINIAIFQTPKTGFSHRDSSQKDIKNIREILEKLNFDPKVKELCDEEGSCRHYPKNKILEELNDIAKEINSKPHENEAFCCVIMSYGGHGFFYDSDAEKVMMSDVMKIFDAQHCPGLILKPKIFILQVCDPDDEIPKKKYKFGDQGPKPGPKPQIQTVPSQADFLVYCSVLSAIFHKHVGDSDEEQNKNPDEEKIIGSAFIECLHDAICSQNGFVNFKNVACKVNRKMEETINSYISKWFVALEEDWKQMYRDMKSPLLMSTMTKQLIFNTELDKTS